MECYFGSYQLPDQNEVAKSAVVAFNIPELGITFKAPFDGVDSEHSDLAALLALLEFIDGNQKYFSNHTYQIFGTNLRVVNFINGREPVPQAFSHLMVKAAKYRHKYRYSLNWVPTDSNQALQDYLDDLAM